MPSKSIQEVLRDHTPELLRIPGVVGTGQGERNGRPTLMVMLNHPADSTVTRLLPRVIEGYPVEVRVVGDVKAPPPP